MATKNISDFRAEVGFYVKGAESSSNTTFVDAQIVRTIRDFCRKTWLWRMTLAEISVVEDQPNYTLTIPTTNGVAELVSIDWVKYKEDGAEDKQYAYLDAINLETEETPSGTAKFGAGYLNETGPAPIFQWLEPDDTLYIAPTPDSTAAGTDNMQVKVILMPDFTATTVPDYVYNDWLECIALGTASRTMKMAAHKWYEPKLSEYYGKLYRKDRDDEVRAQRWEGRGRQKMTVRVNPAFSGSSRSRMGRIF